MAFLERRHCLQGWDCRISPYYRRKGEEPGAELLRPWQEWLVPETGANKKRVFPESTSKLRGNKK